MKLSLVSILFFCLINSPFSGNLNEINAPRQALKSLIIQKLKTIEDPELDVNIYDLGLIREIKITNNSVTIKMIFTKLFCPYAKSMVQEIKRKVVSVDGIKNCKVSVDINTRWKRSMATESGKKKLDEKFSW